MSETSKRVLREMGRPDIVPASSFFGWACNLAREVEALEARLTAAEADLALAHSDTVKRVLVASQKQADAEHERAETLEAKLAEAERGRGALVDAIDEWFFATSDDGTGDPLYRLQRVADRSAQAMKVVEAARSTIDLADTLLAALDAGAGGHPAERIDQVTRELRQVLRAFDSDAPTTDSGTLDPVVSEDSGGGDSVGSATREDAGSAPSGSEFWNPAQSPSASLTRSARAEVWLLAAEHMRRNAAAQGRSAFAHTANFADMVAKYFEGCALAEVRAVETPPATLTPELWRAIAERMAEVCEQCDANAYTQWPWPLSRLGGALRAELRKAKADGE